MRGFRAHGIAVILIFGLTACGEVGGAAAAQPPRAGARAPSTLALTVGQPGAGAVMPQDFLGLSFETPTVHQPAVLTRAPALVRLLEGLGPGLLRVSGDSVDRTQWLPAAGGAAARWAVATLTPSDLEDLAALMRSSGWRLLLGLDLGHAAPQAITDEARTAAVTLGAALAALEIGNEPDLYTRPPSKPFRSQLGAAALRGAGWGLGRYEAETGRLEAALSEAAPRLPLWGPDTATGTWFDAFAARAPAALVTLAPHLYPLDRCLRGRVTRGPSVASLLSRRVRSRESRLIGSYIAAASLRGLPLRIDETNSVACAGQPGVSDTFAAALWALDYGLAAARAGVAGLNFHGGLGSCGAGGTILAPWYSPLCTLAGGQLGARPEYYALLLLRSLEGGAFLPIRYHTSRNLSAYALRAPDGTLRIVIDDMELSAPGGSRGTSLVPRTAPPVTVSVRADPSYQRAGLIRLIAPGVQSRRGVTLGGAAVRPDGGFPGPSEVPIAGRSGHFGVRLRAGSAALLVLRP